MISHLKESHQYLHALCTRPHVRFETQKANEEVLLVLRQHPITQIPWLLNTGFLVIIDIFMNVFLPQFFNINQMIMFNALAFVFIFSYVWINTLLWIFNVGIITNIRIIDVDLFNVLYKEVTETKVTQVSDVTSKIGGFVGSIFQFGDVMVKTEGFEQNIEFLNVPRPVEVVSIINELIPDGEPQ